MSDDAGPDETTWPSDEVVPRGKSLGRYIVVGTLGSGGMGIVYAAYDPELNRKIALKLLKSGRQTESVDEWRRFLMREARAMAGLAHPNVLPIHDVGTHEGQVFIAMDLIDGGTLREWLTARQRGWRDVLSKFRAAGAGLVAAHQAGLVHRDFKPDNVLVGRDGRVCVTDFGLVRSATPHGEEITSPGDSPAERAARPAGLVGTPAYISPEAFTGGTLDARSDQFSFCVALWEGLYGARPFAGETVVDVARAAMNGRIADPPRGPSVPAQLRRALLRGLKAKPEERYPSMLALLGELERVSRSRTRALVGLAIALAILVPIGASAAWVQRQHQLCRGADAHLAGVWDAPEKEKVRAALTSTGRTYATATWSGVERALDGYAQGWTAMWTEACEATRVRGDQPEAMLGARMACLDDRLGAMRALVQLFERVKGDTVEHAVEGAHGLPSLSGCADLASLRMGAPPLDEAERREVEAAQTRLLEARIEMAAGSFESGLFIAHQAAEQGKALRYLPLAAEASELEGRLLTGLGRYAEADHALEDAAGEADRAQADHVRASALIARIKVAGRLGQNKEAERDAQDAAAALDRAGRDEALEAERLENLGRVLKYEGRVAEAEGLLRRAVALSEKAHGHESPEVAEALTGVSVVLVDEKRFDEALATATEALEIQRRLLGPDHPVVADALMNQGVAFRGAGRLAEAHAAGAESAAMFLRAFGPDHPHVAAALATLAATEILEGQDDEARANLGKAIAIRERTFGAESPGVAMATADLAGLEAKEGHWAQALERWKQVLATREKLFGPRHPGTLEAVEGVAAALQHLGRTAEAAGYAARVQSGRTNQVQ